MEINKALNRIGWRFGGNGNKNPFPVNENDIDAFNEISKYIEETQKQQFEKNTLFAKLYITLSKMVLEHYKTTVFDNNARKRIGRILEKPIQQHIEEYTQFLNESELYSLISGDECDLKHPRLNLSDDKDKKVEELQERILNPKNEQIIKGKVWDFETVKECITAEVNLAINLNR